MASILCRHGGTEHTHGSVAETRECQGAVATHIDRDRLANVQDGTIIAETTQVYGQSERQQHPSARATEPGIYKVDGEYYKVQFNQAKTRLYAKVAIPPGSRVEGPDGEYVSVKWEWSYDKGAIYRIKARHKIDAEEASKFGRESGHCVNCHKTIDNPESKRRGYGPVCARNHGWPYDHRKNPNY